MTVFEDVEPFIGARSAPARPQTRHLLPVADLLTASAGIGVATLTGFAPGGIAAVALPMIWLVALYASGSYRARPLDTTSAGDRAATIAAATAVAASAFVADTLVGLPGDARGWLLALAFALFGGLLHRAVRNARTARAISVVAVGDSERLGAALAGLQRSERPVDLVDVRALCGGDLDASDVVAAVERTAADAVIVVPPVDPPELRRLGWQLATTGTKLYVSTPLDDVCASRVRTVESGTARLLEVRPPDRPVSRSVKAAAERIGACALLLCVAPVLLALMLAIRLDSPGSAIFRQQRVGKGGEPFTMLKLRTMRNDAEQVKAALADANDSDGVLFKMKRDPRVTRFGALLRRLSLDELPQLVNVVRGDMALIGPRPALPDEVAQYDEDPMRRLAVKPGITGLWQVSGRADLSWEESVRLDLAYVDNWSLGMDAEILRRTFSAVLAQRGAY